MPVTRPATHREFSLILMFYCTSGSVVTEGNDAHQRDIQMAPSARVRGITELQRADVRAGAEMPVWASSSRLGESRPPGSPALG